MRNIFCSFFFFFTFFGLSFSFLLFSRKRQEFFSFFRRSSIRCFQTKIKTTGALCALFLSLFSRITPMNAQKVEQQYTIVSSSREAALCACARESERAACARPDTTFLKWKKMYGKEIGSERATKRRKKYVSFSLSRNEEEKDDDFRSERE